MKNKSLFYITFILLLLVGILNLHFLSNNKYNVETKKYTSKKSLKKVQRTIRF